MKQDIKSRQSSGKTRFGSQKAGIWKQNEILGRLLKLPGSCRPKQEKEDLFQQDCALQWQGWKTQQKNNRKGQPLQKKRKMLAILWKTIRLLLLKMRLFGKKPVQMELFDDRLLSKKSRVRHRIIGQLFDTYWLVEFDNKFYIIDQHAAHEKVLYERFMKEFADREIVTRDDFAASGGFS